MNENKALAILELFESLFKSLFWDSTYPHTSQNPPWGLFNFKVGSTNVLDVLDLACILGAILLALLPYTKLQLYNKTLNYWSLGKQLVSFSLESQCCTKVPVPCWQMKLLKRPHKQGEQGVFLTKK